VQITGNVGIITATLGAGDSGDITIRSGGNVELTGLGNDNLQQLQLLQLTTDARSLSDPSVSSAIRVVGLNAASLGVGNAGDVTIAARNFQSSQGAILLTAAGGLGRGGDINLAIRETLDISNSLFQASSLIGSSGEAGNINIQATDLHLMENGSLASAALGSGNGGDINVRLSDTFRIDHADFSPGIPAGLFVNSLLGGGNAGNIDIQARAIELNGVGYISSQSGADFPGLGLFDQAGAGGNITIAATDSIRLANGLPNTISSGSITPNPAGNVSIQTPRLILQAGSGISGVVESSQDSTHSPTLYTLFHKAFSEWQQSTSYLNSTTPNFRLQSGAWRCGGSGYSGGSTVSERWIDPICGDTGGTEWWYYDSGR
jgi:hypothetical protein